VTAAGATFYLAPPPAQLRSSDRLDHRIARARFWASAPSRIASDSACAVVAHRSPDKPLFPVLQKR